MRLRNFPRRLKRYVSDFCKDWKFAIHTESEADMAKIRRLEKSRYCHIRDAYVRKQDSEEKTYRILKKEYGQMLAAAPDAKLKAPGMIPKIIWWCWLQGLDAAPELVQTCFESVRKHMSDYEIHIITEKNWHDYIEMPDYVLDRLNDGLMNNTHFADLLRLALLLRYGGVWIDATVLLTGDGLRKLLDKPQNLFMPSYIFYRGYWMLADNWLIAATPDEDILRLTQQLLYAYWKDHKLAINYCIFHIFMAMVAKRYPEQWHNIYPYSRDLSTLLMREMDQPYSPERYDLIKDYSSFHKLSWKIDYCASPGSFYDVLIHHKRY